jgi:hypothetical protein
VRREEERMAKYLTAQLGRLVRDVVRAEVPSDQRARPTRARRSPARRTATARTRSQGSSSAKTTRNRSR